jgi:hypothetical protein
MLPPVRSGQNRRKAHKIGHKITIAKDFETKSLGIPD